MKCRTAIKVLFLYINLCLIVKLDSLSCSLTPISFLIYRLFWKFQHFTKIDLNFNLFIKLKYKHYSCWIVDSLVDPLHTFKSSNKSLKIQSIRQDLQINVREVLKDDTVCFLWVTYRYIQIYRKKRIEPSLVTSHTNLQSN